MRLLLDIAKAGPFIGPRGGKWADAKHTISWTAPTPKKAKAEKEKRKPARGPSREEWVDKPVNPAPVYLDSRAKPGTVLHKLENGGFALGTARRITSTGEKITYPKVYIPSHELNRLVQELRPLAHSSAETMRRRFHLRHGTVDDLRQAAFQGLALALNSYKGGTSFLLRAQDYMRNYAAKEARRHMSGFILPEKLHRAYGGYLAARSKAREAITKRGLAREPTNEEIASTWYVRSVDVYHGKLNAAQGKGSLPMKPWRLQDSAGKPVPGDVAMMPGRVEWASRFASIKEATADVKGSDFFQEGQLESIIPAKEPTPVEVAMGLGDKFSLRAKMDDAIDELAEPHRTALRMKFGFHEPEGEAAKTAEIAAAIKLGGKRKQLSLRRKTDMVPTIVQEAKERFVKVIRENPEYRGLANALPGMAGQAARSKKTLAQWLAEKKAEPFFHLTERDRELLIEPEALRPEQRKRSQMVVVTDPFTGETKRMQAWMVSNVGGRRPIMTEEVEVGMLAHAEKSEDPSDWMPRF